jgi:hypothetical protein
MENDPAVLGDPGTANVEPCSFYRVPTTLKQKKTKNIYMPNEINKQLTKQTIKQ